MRLLRFACLDRLDCGNRICAVFFLFAVAITSPAQTFKSLASFDYTDGAIPFGLIQGTDGSFYGSTDKGGTGTNHNCNASCGAIFKITPAGALSAKHSFDGIDGNGPSGLVQATSGTFYGTASYGGANNCTSYGSTGPCGTIFSMTLAGTAKPIYNFCSKANCTDGAIPWGGLVQGTDGNLYGTTVAGGTGTGCTVAVGPGCGTVFKITPGGTLTTLHSFAGTDGSYPYSGLIQSTNGNFYGTTSYGGANGYGTVFEITSAGALTTLHSFAGTDGGYSYSGLVQATSGNFYGTTSASSVLLITGGPSCTESGIGYGTVFEMTTGGTLTTLHSFADTDGAVPYGGLVQAADGNFYGPTGCGGANSDGTVFKITAKGTLTTLHSFAGTDGSYPYSGLAQATSGIFYGTTILGGTDNDGTVFSLSVGLGPFVETRPSSGKVGATVVILGNKLTGASSVDFNGTAATFTVSSSSLITATVPTGASTGLVTVTTPSATLKSNQKFRVKP